MEQSKFSIADVLTLIAALAFGFVSFLGANFLNINNEKVWGMSHTTGCIVIAAVITFMLFITAYGLKRFKIAEANFKTNVILEGIFLLLFVVFAAFFTSKISPFTHYFTVSDQKEEIKSKLQSSITQAENMFDAYEKYAQKREKLYKQKLQSVVNAKRVNPEEYKKYGFNTNAGVSDASQIATKMDAVHMDLFPSNYSNPDTKKGLKEVATNWLNHAKNTISGWKPIGIVGVVNKIEKESNEWLDQLVSLSQVREKGEQAEDFAYDLKFDNVKTHFTKLKSPTPMSIGLAFLAYALMLVSWLVSKRSTRFPGFKILFGLDKSSNNEL